ncbi:hypothetical protein ACQEVF_32405 [Nonomuraea polychroma]|uniref:hypothetical protein n=1 Tax=Nonomuraea polychroma TaxID=46176 RepID=UPI003D93279F
MTTPLPPGLQLPADLVAVVYFCHVCEGKHTYGRDYVTETGGLPTACPNCSTPFVQEDRVLRVEADTFEGLEAKKRDLFAKRGRALPGRPKPDDPKEIKKQRIHGLEEELRRLRGGEDSPGVRLGP